MSLASLDVSLTLGLAKFEADSRQAETAAYRLGTRIGDGLVDAGKAVASFTALAGTAAVGVLAWADRSIKATAELHGLAEQTGIAASELQSFRTASDTSGVSLDAIAKLSERLSTTLSKPIDPTRGAGAALAAIGLSADQLRAQKPDEQIETIAKALAGFDEGAGRTAVAVTLLGKSGAAALPFLNDLAESGRSQIKLTDEQIDAADRYSKSSARTRSEFGQLAQAAALQALPAMNAFTEALRDTARAVVGVDVSTKTLGTSTAVATFSENAVLALGHVVDAGDGVIRTFGAVGRFVGAYAAVSGALLKGEVAQAKTIAQEFRDDTDALLQAPLFSDRLAARLAASKIPAAADPAKPVLNFRIPDAAKATAAATASTAAYDGLIRSITAKTSAAEAELEGGEKLTAGQQFALQIVTQLAASEGRFTDAQKRSTTAVLEAYLAAENLVEAQREEAKWLKETGDENARNTDSLMKTRDAYEAQAQASRDQLALFGLTREQVDALSAARLRDTAASLREKAAAADSAYLEDNARLYLQQADAIEANAEALDRLAARQLDARTNPYAGLTQAAKDYLDQARDLGTATRSAVSGALGALENDLTTSLATGKTSLKNFTDFAISEFYRLVLVRPALAALTQQLEDLSKASSTSSSVLSSIVGLFAGSGSGASTNLTGGSLPTAGGAATGTNFVERDMLTIIHKGEAVVPKAFNPYAGYGGGMARVQQSQPAGGWSERPLNFNVTNNSSAVVNKPERDSNGDWHLLVEMAADRAHSRVAADVASGSGRVAGAMKARGLNVNGNLPKRG